MVHAQELIRNAGERTSSMGGCQEDDPGQAPEYVSQGWLVIAHNQSLGNVSLES